MFQNVTVLNPDLPCWRLSSHWPCWAVETVTVPHSLNYSLFSISVSSTEKGNCRHQILPSAARGASRRVSVVCADLTSSTKPEVHNALHCHLSSEKNWATAAARSTHSKFGEGWTCSCWDTWAERQTDTLIAVLRTSILGAKWRSLELTTV